MGQGDGVLYVEVGITPYIQKLCSLVPFGKRGPFSKSGILKIGFWKGFNFSEKCLTKNEK
jgi:hypothetical protein